MPPSSGGKLLACLNLPSSLTHRDVTLGSNKRRRLPAERGGFLLASGHPDLMLRQKASPTTPHLYDKRFVLLTLLLILWNQGWIVSLQILKTLTVLLSCRLRLHLPLLSFSLLQPFYYYLPSDSKWCLGQVRSFLKVREIEPAIIQILNIGCFIAEGSYMHKQKEISLCISETILELDMLQQAHDIIIDKLCHVEEKR
ncbi:unnamed protein product [Lactuca virosa]|uniref:Uncharacterized protein n=1 Tax=Lactuca virosa TaxID=75947 RepID=A0AAU9P1L4_9ASTR|nr:unnamed protein product [Lactuca virosa]